MTTPQELIEQGIEIIKRDGWHQGGLCKVSEEPIDSVTEYNTRYRLAALTAPVCAIGAVNRAAFGSAVAMYADEVVIDTHRDTAAKAIRMLHLAAPGGNGMGPYNDAPTTSKEDVLLLMRRVAAGEE